MVYWDKIFVNYGSTDNNLSMNKLDHYLKYERWYVFVGLIGYFLINNTILATSVLMEAQRRGGTPDFHTWEPFVWEYTSAISSLLLLPILINIMNRYPLAWNNLKGSVPFYLLLSIPFSLAHVGAMVAMRKLVYWTQGGSYNFGNLGFELVYEFRKDFWGYVVFLIAIKGYQFTLSRLKGEANLIATGEDPVKNQPCDRLLVKKLGKEFIIKVEDVEWLEASGNYVNLHIAGRIYPTRATLSGLIDQISDKGFCRIHRSHAVNLDAIDSITPLNSGDSEVRLTNGKILNLSRRYKDDLKARLH